MARKSTSATTFAQFWESSSTLVALFDSERQLRYLNPAAATWLNVDAPTLLGGTALLASPIALQTPLAGLAPPVEAFAGQACLGSIYAESSTSGPQVRPATFLPVQQNEQTWVLLLASRDDMINSSLLPLPEAMSMWHTSLQTWLAKVPRLLHEIYLVGNSPPMRQLRKQLQVAQQTRAHVEMICPPGTGGAMIAAMLQRSGTAPLQAPITLDCALHNAESLGELLRGLGRLSKEHALSQHTIYCEQLHLLAPAAQSRLLKWLQAIAEPPRMIHSSPRSLAYYVTQGRFSADLAAELAIARIRVLPLRKRLADVPLLAQWCVEKWNATTGQNLSGVSPEALDRLLAYHWPENVDEFQRYLTQACEAAEDTWVQERDLPERLRTHWQALCYPPKEQVKIQLDQFLGQMEQEILERALREAKQNKSKAAELLGITRQRLLRRLTQFGLIKSDEETIDFQPLDPEANSQDMP